MKARLSSERAESRTWQVARRRGVVWVIAIVFTVGVGALCSARAQDDRGDEAGTGERASGSRVQRGSDWKTVGGGAERGATEVAPPPPSRREQTTNRSEAPRQTVPQGFEPDSNRYSDDGWYEPPAESSHESAYFGPFSVPEGFMILGSFAFTEVSSSDLDGSTVLVNPSEGAVILLPELDSGMGFNFGIGFRSESLSFELTYERTEHDASFLGAQTEADFNSVNMDLRWHFLTENRIHPNLLFGFGIPWLTMENVSGNVLGDVDDGTLFGLAARLGGGLTYYPFDDNGLGIQVTGGYRFGIFTTASGAGDSSGSLEDTIDASGFFFNAGLTYTF